MKADESFETVIIRSGGQSNDSESGSTATVRFDDQTVQDDSIIVTVAPAQFKNESVPEEGFVVVVHETSSEAYRSGGENEIGPKVGKSDVLSPGTRQNITVDLNTAFGSSDSLRKLTQNQTLVTMFHRADTTNSDSVNHGAHITRDGDPVTARAELTVEAASSPFSEGKDVSGIGAGKAPTDPDDGKFEDINGDREATFDDVIALTFVNQTQLNSQQTTALDFDSDGNVGFDNVIELRFE
jgi:hypothetical protein